MRTIHRASTTRVPGAGLLGAGLLVACLLGPAAPVAHAQAPSDEDEALREELESWLNDIATWDEESRRPVVREEYRAELGPYEQMIGQYLQMLAERGPDDRIRIRDWNVIRPYADRIRGLLGPDGRLPRDLQAFRRRIEGGDPGLRLPGEADPLPGESPDGEDDDAEEGRSAERPRDRAPVRFVLRDAEGNERVVTPDDLREFALIGQDGEYELERIQLRVPDLDGELGRRIRRRLRRLQDDEDGEERAEERRARRGPRGRLRRLERRLRRLERRFGGRDRADDRCSPLRRVRRFARRLLDRDRLERSLERLEERVGDVRPGDLEETLERLRGLDEMVEGEDLEEMRERVERTGRVLRRAREELRDMDPEEREALLERIREIVGDVEDGDDLERELGEFLISPEGQDVQRRLMEFLSSEDGRAMRRDLEEFLSSEEGRRAMERARELFERFRDLRRGDRDEDREGEDERAPRRPDRPLF